VRLPQEVSRLVAFAFWKNDKNRPREIRSKRRAEERRHGNPTVFDRGHLIKRPEEVPLEDVPLRCL
jgi:hypothetical protein